MTTIATDGKTIAADTQQCGNFIAPVPVRKLWRIGGRLVGMAGAIEDYLLFLEWLKSPKSRDKPTLGKHFEALVVEKRVEVFYRSLIPVEVGAPAAIGSGSSFAMGAMLQGASPASAIRVAIKLDPYTGGKVKCLTL